MSKKPVGLKTFDLCYRTQHSYVIFFFSVKLGHFMGNACFSYVADTLAYRENKKTKSG